MSVSSRCCLLEKWKLTDQGPGNDTTQSARDEDRQRVGMGTITTESRQELFAALVRHKVCRSPERVSHYLRRISNYIFFAEVNEGRNLLRCSLNPVYSPLRPRCLMMFPSVFIVPLFW